MSATLATDQRFFPRYLPVVTSFAGRLRRDGEELGGHVIDVSRDGLGAVIPVCVDRGDTLELTVGDRTILFHVVYCHQDLIRKGQYRLGLRRTGSTENLVSLFRASGYLGED